MTTQPAHVTPRESTRDLFAAFAQAIISSDEPEETDEDEAMTIRATLWLLTDVTDPLTFEVLAAIHAERRRRMSAATREERRG